MNPSKEARLEALRGYLRTVTRDLLMRGVIRHQKGQSIDSIFAAELGTVLGEVSSDFNIVLREMGAGLLQGFSSLISGMLFGR